MEGMREPWKLTCCGNQSIAARLALEEIPKVSPAEAPGRILARSRDAKWKFRFKHSVAIRYLGGDFATSNEVEADNNFSIPCDKAPDISMNKLQVIRIQQETECCPRQSLQQ